jgi:WD40 repeat protein
VNVADIKWKTRHCVLGFSLMGIWPMYADGTDINAVDVCVEKGLVVTANDTGGLVKLFNFPCVVKNAPGKDYTGHSSHVTSVKFMSGGDSVASAGGKDSSVVVWDVVYDESVDNPDKFR